MAEAEGRRRALLFVVLGIIALVVVGYLVVVLTQGGDETDQIDPQNGEVVTLFLGL